MRFGRKQKEESKSIPNRVVESAKAPLAAAPVETLPGCLVPPQEAFIRVRNLKKIYRVGQTKVRALNGVSFDIREGEFCAIVGTSGSGKSTLLNMLAGLEPPTSGTVQIGKRDITGLSENDLVSFRRQEVGFIFQSFNLIPTLDAVENVALPLVFRAMPRQKRQALAIRLLKLVGLTKHMKHKPTEMSGGQQQRVGVARALVVEPSIVFADEPTGNLDSRTSEEIMQLMQRVTKEKNQTLIMVTHDDHLAAWADRIFRIIDGQIVSIEEGSHSYEAQQFEHQDANA